MARYIDAEDFKHLINASSLYDTKEWVKVLTLLADTPTASNVVEVVRCKDCVHKKEHFDTIVKCGCGQGTNYEGFFCAYGERRDE